jgi:O-antigen/teichoic acid export membrane protein
MLARKILLIFGAQIINALLSLISLFFIAQYMGPTPLGIIGFANGLIELFAPSLGFDTAHYKRVSEGKELDKCIGTFVLIKVALACFLITTIVCGIFMWKSLFGGFESYTHQVVIYIVLATTVIINLSFIMLSTFGAKKETAKQQIPQLIGSFIRVPIIVFVAVTSLGVIFLAGAYTISALIVFIVALILFRDYPVSKPNKKYLKSYAKFAIPAMVGEISFMVSINLDKIMIGYFFDFNEVGYYIPVQQIITPLMFIATATGMILLPTISAIHSKNDKYIEQIKQITHAAERYGSMFAVPIIMLIIVFSESIVSIILGDEFLSSINILRILALMPLFAITIRPYGILIEGINRPDIAGKLDFFVVLINILLNLIFIPKELGGVELFGFGAIGAALATLISWVIRSLLIHIFVYKLTRIKPNPKVIVHFITGVVIGASLYFVTGTIPSYQPYYIVPLSVIGVGCYFGILYFVRDFRKDDIHFLSDLLNLKKMGEYIQSEIKEKNH